MDEFGTVAKLPEDSYEAVESNAGLDEFSEISKVLVIHLREATNEKHQLTPMGLEELEQL